MVEMKASPAVKLDTLSDVNDLGKSAVDGLPSLVVSSPFVLYIRQKQLKWRR